MPGSKYKHKGRKPKKKPKVSIGLVPNKKGTLPTMKKLKKIQTEANKATGSKKYRAFIDALIDLRSYHNKVKSKKKTADPKRTKYKLNQIKEANKKYRRPLLKYSKKIEDQIDKLDAKIKQIISKEEDVSKIQPFLEKFENKVNRQKSILEGLGKTAEMEKMDELLKINEIRQKQLSQRKELTFTLEDFKKQQISPKERTRLLMGKLREHEVKVRKLEEERASADEIMSELKKARDLVMQQRKLVKNHPLSLEKIDRLITRIAERRDIYETEKKVIPLEKEKRKVVMKPAKFTEMVPLNEKKFRPGKHLAKNIMGRVNKLKEVEMTPIEDIPEMTPLGVESKKKKKKKK